MDVMEFFEKDWVIALIALIGSILGFIHYSVRAEEFLLPDKEWAATFFPYSFLFDVFRKEGNYYRVMAAIFTLASIFCVAWFLYVTLWRD